MKKRFSLLVVIFLSLFSFFTINVQAASAWTTFDFNTSTPAVREHRITYVSPGANIRFSTDFYWYRVNNRTWVEQGGIQNDRALSVKLCRAGTSTCTTTKSLYGEPTFYNMNGGNYDVYVYDNELDWIHYGNMLYEVFR